MKKIMIWLTAILIALSLAGCRKTQDNKELSNDMKRQEVILTVENLWYYFDYDKNIIKKDSDIIEFQVNGLMIFAVYDHVSLVLDYIYYQNGMKEEEYYHWYPVLKLNIAGNGKFSYHTDWTPIDAPDNIKSMKDFVIKIDIKSVEGKVIYFS